MSPVAITELLNGLGDGNRESLPELVTLIYPELRRLAVLALRRESTGHTLQTTALVHEAFLRLFNGSLPDWENRAHFFSAAAHQMRLVLVDHARKKKAIKRGGGSLPQPLSGDAASVPALFERTLMLDQAIERLSSIDARAAQIVEMRFFVGLRHEEIAAILNLHTRTVEADWKFARAWLRRALTTAA